MYDHIQSMVTLENLIKYSDEPDQHSVQIYREITSMTQLIGTATNGLRKYNMSE